ncbi:unnamed protein product [Gemmata massiliana]|uniref:Uncharacterized protein n=1 Tax=Gemmata massiliana TaxID=1210884 RepID=A0A6P2CYX7_9BACT|nr:hypothetical protein [Gemmata massiliana]VTR94338.1 unnamed protein product [Gemmata massiliana]
MTIRRILRALFMRPLLPVPAPRKDRPKRTTKSVTSRTNYRELKQLEADTAATIAAHTPSQTVQAMPGYVRVEEHRSPPGDPGDFGVYRIERDGADPAAITPPTPALAAYVVVPVPCANCPFRQECG